MKPYLKPVFCFLLIAALTFQLAGCAGTPTAPTGPNAPGTPTEPNAPANPGKTEAGVVDLMSGIKPASAGTGERPSPEAAAAATDFSLRLFRAAKETDQNTLLSPASVLAALAMTANGAKGDTLTQMEQTLGLSRNELNVFFRSWLNALAGDGTLKQANSVWFTADARFTVNGDFLQTNADFYGADVYRAPFDQETLKAINDWVKAKTDGMIPEILDKIPPEAVMYLINALAFEAKWAVPYTEYAVQEGEFRCADGNIAISRVIHKTFISVAEQGTRAGAATVVEMTPEAAFIEDPKQVRLDRPFVYLLIDTKSCVPLFIGAMLDPEP